MTCSCWLVMVAQFLVVIACLLECVRVCFSEQQTQSYNLNHERDHGNKQVTHHRNAEHFIASIQSLVTESDIHRQVCAHISLIIHGLVCLTWIEPSSWVLSLFVLFSFSWYKDDGQVKMYLFIVNKRLLQPISQAYGTSNTNLILQRSNKNWFYYTY